MEFRSQDQKTIGIPDSFNLTYVASSHEQAPAKQLNLAAAVMEADRGAEEIRQEEHAVFTSSADHHQQHHNNHSFQVRFHHPSVPNRHHHQNQPQNTQRSRKGPETQDLIPDSVPVSVANSRPDGQDASPSDGIFGTATNAVSAIRYRECQKNHAAHLGGHVVDGCCEFMAGGEEGTPESFKCAACDCHRNFHRKESDGKLLPPSTNANYRIPYQQSNPKHMSMTPTAQPVAPIIQLSPQPPVYHHNHHQRVLSTSFPVHHHPTMMAFGGGAPAESSSEDLNIYGASIRPPLPSETNVESRKRFRTKFSQEQKDKMMQFAEKLGWRIQKQDEAQVQQFCDEAGVKRRVFKVWMHNNKQAMKRKQS